MLSDIVSTQKRDVAKLKAQVSFEELKRKLTSSQKNFLGHLLATKTSYIFECKFASPSEGKLKENYPFMDIAKTYADYANAISVLTNQFFFGGSFEHLSSISQSITLPVLCKDIIVDSYQLAQARYHGADAVLLMLSVLDDETYLACREYALSLNMTVLTEVYSEQELERAKAHKANVIVVNHRDLSTMKLDMKRIAKLHHQLPKDAYIIAASGLQSYQDIQPLLGKVNGFLIGSSLMKSNNLIKTIHDLIYGPLKICGLTTKEDAHLAYSLGATYGGIIFAENSKRKISLEQAMTLLQPGLEYVGVFVNQPLEHLVNIAKKLSLSAVQLHGQENQEYISALRNQLPATCQIFKAVDGTQRITTFMPAFVDKLIVDNKIGDQLGGSGESFDWEALKGHPLLDKIMLSGGINANNILHARKYGCWGIDVNSGVELSPGIKDKTKLMEFFKTLKQGYHHANA